jgi:hypothetical protein
MVIRLLFLSGGFMKKLLLVCSMMSMNTLMATEKAQIIEALEKKATEGSFAATALLVENAYDNGVLHDWLKKHGDLWKSLNKIDEMSFAYEWLNPLCCKVLEKIKDNADKNFVEKLTPSSSDEFLAKKLWLCKRLGILSKMLENNDRKESMVKKIKKYIVELKALADQDAESSFRQDIGNLTQIVYDRCVNPEKNSAIKKGNVALQKDYQKMRILLAQRREEIKKLKEKEHSLLQVQSGVIALEALINVLKFDEQVI